MNVDGSDEVGEEMRGGRDGGVHVLDFVYIEKFSPCNALQKPSPRCHYRQRNSSCWAPVDRVRGKYAEPRNPLPSPSKQYEDD